MKTWKKAALGLGAGLLLAAIVAFTVYQSRKNSSPYKPARPR